MPALDYKTTRDIGRGLEVLATTLRWVEQVEGHYQLAWVAWVEAVLYLKRGSYFQARLVSKTGLETTGPHQNSPPTSPPPHDFPGRKPYNSFR